MHPFAQIDHPLILVAQAALALGLLSYYFRIHRKPGTLPYIIAVLAFVVWLNFTARIVKFNWFWIIDATQYIGFASIVWVAWYVVGKEQQVEPITEPDRVDRWQPRIVPFGGVVLFCMLMYTFVDTYNQAQASEQRERQAALRENTRVRKEQAQKEQANEARRDTIAADVAAVKEALPVLTSTLASVTATQQTMLAGQRQLAKRAVPKRIVYTFQQPSSITTVSVPAAPAPKREVTAPPAPKPERRGWRIWPFGQNTSTRYDYPLADTLARYQQP